MTPEHFIKKWTAADLSERSAAQHHFLDLCALLGELTPAEADPDGDTYTFEKGGTTAIGGHGWADVWKKGAFAWEYKGPGKDLNAAYLQLKKYADMLENPPELVDRVPDVVPGYPDRLQGTRRRLPIPRSGR